MNFIAPRAEPLIREIPLSRLALAPENVNGGVKMYRRGGAKVSHGLGCSLSR